MALWRRLGQLSLLLFPRRVTTVVIKVTTCCVVLQPNPYQRAFPAPLLPFDGLLQYLYVHLGPLCFPCFAISLCPIIVASRPWTRGYRQYDPSLIIASPSCGVFASLQFGIRSCITTWTFFHRACLCIISISSVVCFS